MECVVFFNVTSCRLVNLYKFSETYGTTSIASVEEGMILSTPADEASIFLWNLEMYFYQCIWR